MIAMASTTLRILTRAARAHMLGGIPRVDALEIAAREIGAAPGPHQTAGVLFLRASVEQVRGWMR